MLAALISGEPKFIAMLSSKLDKDSRTIGNWKSLATQFGIRKQMTEQFGLRGLGPTAALFEHMSTADGLKDLTMSELREHFVAMERKDLINILKRHKFEGLFVLFCLVIIKLISLWSCVLFLLYFKSYIYWHAVLILLW